VYSTGAEWQFHPAPRFGTVVGGAANIQQRPDGTTEQEPTWIAGVTFDAAAATRVHASTTRKVRLPSIEQLFSATAGNPELRAEHAYGVDVGLDQKIGSASTVTISVFNTRAYDFIERDSGAPFENQERYRFRGAEVAGQTTWLPRLNLRGAYSFLDSDDLADESDVQPLQTRPRHRASLEWAWKPFASSAVRGAVYRTGTQLFDSRGANLVQRPADPYTLVDLGFTQTLAGRFDIAFDITNVFDTLYEQGYGLPREGRAAVITLRARMR
jgi:outer membrane receptor protein involved in Fe transport